jgi:hypothetical protein
MSNSTSTMTGTSVPTWLRASQLPAYFPVFGATAWRTFIRTGQLPSRKIGAARVVSTADVERFLAGPGSAECA